MAGRGRHSRELESNVSKSSLEGMSLLSPLSFKYRAQIYHRCSSKFDVGSACRPSPQCLNGVTEAIE
jgi:hypothetical protein